MGANLNNLGRFFSGTLFGLLGKSNNNPYISQPNFYNTPFRLDKHEEWVTINNAEEKIYQTTPELRLVVDRLARMYANGVWKHIGRNGEEIENSPFVNLLENPNVQQSRNEYQFQWYIQRSLYPSVFNYMLRGSVLQDVPSALWNLPPARMVVNRTGKIWDQQDIEGIISSYTMRMEEEGKEGITYKTDDIIQFTMPGANDPIMGTSPLIAIRMPLSNIRAAYGYGNVILTKKGAIGIWSSEKKDQFGSMPLTDPEQKALSDQLTSTYGIFDDQASVKVSATPIKWEASTYKTKDLLLGETIEDGMRRIVDMYGANMDMFSVTRGATFENKAEGNLQCYQDTLTPVGADQANGYSKRFGLLDKGEKLTYTFDHLPPFKEDKKERSEVDKNKAETVAILVANGVKFVDAAEIVEWDFEGKNISAPVITTTNQNS